MSARSSSADLVPSGGSNVAVRKCNGKCIAKFVFATLMSASFIFGLLGVLAVHGKLPPATMDFFKRFAAKSHCELLALSVAFLSVGAAGLLASYYIIRPSKKIT